MRLAKCLSGHGVLALSLMFGLTSCIQPVQPIVRQEKGLAMQSHEVAHSHHDSFAVSATGGLLKTAQDQKVGRSPVSSLSETSSKSKAGQPAVLTYEDKECTNEVVSEGFYLPPKIEMWDRRCAWVTLVDEKAQKTLDEKKNFSERKTSMEFICAESGGVLKLILHKGDDCKGGADDKFKVIVNKIDFNPLQQGKCTQVVQEEANQTVYIKIMNHDSVREWPSCMKDWTFIIYGCIAGGVGFLLIVLWICCLIRSYRKKKKAKHQGNMYGPYGKGMPFMKGKGGMDFKGKGDFGKGKPNFGKDAGKGKFDEDFGKGKFDKGKGKMFGKDKWSKGAGPAPEFPVEVAPPPPEPGPLDISVTVVSASGLRKADVTGKSDPYCEAEVLGKAKMQFKTKVIKETLDPEWNHSDRFKGFDQDDKMQFTVYDEDMGGAKKDLLGKAILTYKEVFPDGFEGEIKLEEAGDAPEAKLKIKVEIIQIIKPKENEDKKEGKEGKEKKEKDGKKDAKKDKK